MSYLLIVSCCHAIIWHNAGLLLIASWSDQWEWGANELIAYSLLLPSHYLTQCWLIVNCFLIRPMRMKFSRIWIKIHHFSSKKINLEVLSANWQPFCLSLIVIMSWYQISHGRPWFWGWRPHVKFKPCGLELWGRSLSGLLSMLTQWGPDIMAAIFADNLFKGIFFNESFEFLLNLIGFCY